MSSSEQRFGLSQQDLHQIITVLDAFPNVSEAIIFGSRAKGNYKPGSDIDIALKGENLDSVITKISYLLNEELTLPYYFDILDFASITHQELKEHITRVGITFYLRSAANR